MTWRDEVLALVMRLPRRFSLQDCYRNAEDLVLRHPDNDHVDAKIRQQLQVLRGEGLIRFVDDDGHYERLV